MGLAGKFSGVRIVAVAASVPESVVKNDAYLSVQDEETLKKFEKMTGVLERRHVIALTTSELALDSAIALQSAGAWDADDVDAILFVSQTPDYQLPATACRLHGELGLKHDCLALDINLGCSGFVYGLHAASSFIVSGSCRKILLVGGDCISRVAKKNDAANQMLFGDAGFAAVIECDETDGHFLPYLMGTNGVGCDAIYARGGGLRSEIKGQSILDSCLHMDGPEVFDFTISAVPSAIKDFCDAFGQSIDSFDHFAFHQANKFILKQIAMLSGFKSSKHLMSIGTYGNTSSASIPLTLCANLGDVAGQTLMAGFGVGLSWGIMSYDFTDTKLLPVREVKERSCE